MVYGVLKIVSSLESFIRAFKVMEKKNKQVSQLIKLSARGKFTSASKLTTKLTINREIN